MKPIIGDASFLDHRAFSPTPPAPGSPCRALLREAADILPPQPAPLHLPCEPLRLDPGVAPPGGAARLPAAARTPGCRSALAHGTSRTGPARLAAGRPQPGISFSIQHCGSLSRSYRPGRAVGDQSSPAPAETFSPVLQRDPGLQGSAAAYATSRPGSRDAAGRRRAGERPLLCPGLAQGSPGPHRATRHPACDLKRRPAVRRQLAHSHAAFRARTAAMPEQAQRCDFEDSWRIPPRA